MKVAVLGTGMVGKALSQKLHTMGHKVSIGTRSVEATVSKLAPMDADGLTYESWLSRHEGIQMRSFRDSITGAEIIISSLSGKHAVATLGALADEIGDRVVIDTTNPLDFSHGAAPVLSVTGADSLSEQIQAALPRARVVKALNTVGFSVMVDPQAINDGNHILPICGNDEAAKAAVRLLLEQMGWRTGSLVDLGDLTNARGMEAYLLYWFRLMGKLGTSSFNIEIVR